MQKLVIRFIYITFIAAPFFHISTLLSTHIDNVIKPSNYSTWSHPVISCVMRKSQFRVDERSPIETASILDYLDGECFKNNEGTFGRMMEESDDMTVEKCQGICFDDNEEILHADGRLDMMPVYAGVQNGNECWCGDIKPTTPADVQSECSKPCSGDNSQKCGGKSLINMILKQVCLTLG